MIYGDYYIKPNHFFSDPDLNQPLRMYNVLLAVNFLAISFVEIKAYGGKTDGDAKMQMFRGQFEQWETSWLVVFWWDDTQFTGVYNMPL